MTSLLQKVVTRKADALKAKDVLLMATKNGYKAYKIRGGELKKGFLADLILVERERFNYYPIYEPVHSIVYASYGCEVTHTIVDGEIVMEDSVVLTMDEERILSKIEKIRQKFVD